MHTLLVGDADDLFDSHRDIWDFVKDHYARYRDVPTIDTLETSFRDFEPVKVDSPTQFYVDQLRTEKLNVKLREALLRAGAGMKESSPEKVLQGLEEDISTLTKYTHAVHDLDLTDWKDAETYFDKIKQRSDAMGGSPGIRTGLASIDTAYPTGMAAGHYIVSIGYPARGKTWFTAYLAVKAWEQGFRPMIVTLEMSPQDMRNRIYGLMASGLFQVSDFQRGSIDSDQFREWAKKNLEDKNTFTVLSSDGLKEMTPNVIQGKIDQHRPDLVICDYMQLMSDNRKSENLTPRMMNLSRELKLLAVGNDIPVMAISAVTMDDTRNQDDPPMLSQVAWSKGIEYDADLAFSVHQHEGTPIIEVVCRKNRHGGQFSVYLEVDLNNGIINESFNRDD